MLTGNKGWGGCSLLLFSGSRSRQKYVWISFLDTGQNNLGIRGQEEGDCHMIAMRQSRSSLVFLVFKEPRVEKPDVSLGKERGHETKLTCSDRSRLWLSPGISHRVIDSFFFFFFIIEEDRSLQSRMFTKCHEETEEI